MFDFLKKRQREKDLEEQIKIQAARMKKSSSTAGFVCETLKKTAQMYLLAIYSQNAQLLPAGKMSPGLYQLACDSIMRDRDNCSRTCSEVNITVFSPCGGEPEVRKKLYANYRTCYEIQGTFNRKDIEDKGTTIFIFRHEQRMGWVLHDIEEWEIYI